MKTLKTNKGNTVYLDDKWADLFSLLTIYENSKGTPFINCRRFKHHKEFLHRIILGALPWQQVDHIDRNKYNSISSNLRICTGFENARNKAKFKLKRGESTSKYKGVYYCRGHNSVNPIRVWRVNITFENKRHFLGRYSTDMEAAMVYNIFAEALHGEFAFLNDV